MSTLKKTYHLFAALTLVLFSDTRVLSAGDVLKNFVVLARSEVFEMEIWRLGKVKEELKRLGKKGKNCFLFFT